MLEGVVAGDFPGERGEDPVAVGGELGGLRLEDGFVGAVKDIDGQAVGGEVELDGVVVLVLGIGLKGFEKVLVQAAEHGQLDGGGGIEIAGAAFDGLGFLAGDDADGILGDGGKGIAEGALDGFLDALVLRGKPEHHEQRHHGGDEIRVGTFQAPP